MKSEKSGDHINIWLSRNFKKPNTFLCNMLPSLQIYVSGQVISDGVDLLISNTLMSSCGESEANTEQRRHYGPLLHHRLPIEEIAKFFRYESKSRNVIRGGKVRFHKEDGKVLIG